MLVAFILVSGMVLLSISLFGFKTLKLCVLNLTKLRQANSDKFFILIKPELLVNIRYKFLTNLVINHNQNTSVQSRIVELSFQHRSG